MGYQKWSDADLSAYLDGQLSPDQARTLESALQNNQELNARLEGLKTVVGLMRELPVHEAPRNYILTPSMVEANPKQPVRRYRAPLFMRVATSLTAAAFIITMGVNVFLSSPISLPFATMSAPAEETYAEPEMMMMADEDMEAEPQEAPRAMEVEETATEKVVASVPMTVEVESESVAAVEEEADGVGENGELPVDIGIGGGGEPELGAATLLPEEEGEGQVEEESFVAESATDDAENAAMPEEPIVESTESPSDTPVEEIAPMPTATLQVIEEAPLPILEEQPVWNEPQTVFPVWLPWTLGGCALVLGIVTWITGRRRR